MFVLKICGVAVISIVGCCVCVCMCVCVWCAGVSSECADGGGGVIDEIAPLPHHVGKEGAAVLENKPHSQTFPILDATLLQVTHLMPLGHRPHN